MYIYNSNREWGTSRIILIIQLKMDKVSKLNVESFKSLNLPKKESY